MLRGEEGYVLFLTVAMLAATAVFFVTLHNVYRTRYGHVAAFGNSVRARYAAEAGIEMARDLVRREGVRELLKGPLEGKLDRGSYSVVSEMEGGYLRVRSRGRWLKETFDMGALLGERPSGALSDAVRLNTRDRDLVVGGGNRVRGNIRLVKGKVFTNQITGYAFTGDSACEGRVIDSSAVDTLHDKGLRAFMKECGARFSTTQGCDEVIHGSLFYDRDRPFDRGGGTGKTVYIEGGLFFDDEIEATGPVRLIVEGNVELSKRAMLRNATLFCGGRVTVRDKAALEDVLVFSRGTVSLSDETSVSGQILCMDSIRFAGASSSRYPFFAYSLPQFKEGQQKGGIFCLDSSRLCGVFVVALADSNSTSGPLTENRPFMRIAARVRLQGVIFNTYSTEYRGRVRGHITTASFLLEEGGYLFGNLLFNTDTDRPAMDSRLLLPLIFSDRPALMRVRTVPERRYGS